MSEEIEELVNNLNSSLTYAIKSTLGPYIQKLNLNNEKYKVFTSILKSLPEYKEMENENLFFKNENKKISEICHEYIKINAMLQRDNEIYRTKLEHIIDKNVNNTMINKNIDANNEENTIDKLNLNEMKKDQEEKKDVNENGENKKEEEKVNVDLNVIEKIDDNMVSDIKKKVKDIYSEANIDCNISNLITSNNKEVIKLSSNKISEEEKEKEIQNMVLQLEKHLMEQNKSNEEDSEEDNEEELFAINIDGFDNEFYTSDKMNGDIYEVNDDDSIGKLLGKFENGIPIWNNKKKYIDNILK